METYKKTFYREGKTYSLIVRRNNLAGYAVSFKSKVVYYQIFTIKTNRAGIECVTPTDENQILTYARFLELWEILNRTADKRRSRNSGLAAGNTNLKLN